MNLAETQAKLVNFITGKNSDLTGFSISRIGLQLYQNLVESEYESLLNAIYPGTKFFCKDSWQEIVSQFIRELPSSDFNFNRCAAAFSEFLFDLGQPDFLVAIADYEYTLLAVTEKNVEFELIAPEDQTEFLTAIRHRPTVNPSLFCRQYPYDVPLLIASALIQESIAIEAAEKTSRIVIFSDGHRHKSLELNDENWQLLQVLVKGESFQSAIFELSKKLDKPVKVVAPSVISEIRRYFQEGLLVKPEKLKEIA